MRYKPFNNVDGLGPEEALVQAASALDAAGTEASAKHDVEGLLNVGAMWIKLSDQILEYSKVVAEEDTPNGEMVKSEPGTMQTGFCIVPDPIVAEEDDDGRIEE